MINKFIKALVVIVICNNFYCQAQSVPGKNNFENRINLTLKPYRKGDKWGFSDSTKKIIVPIKYEGVKTFINHRSLVWLNSKFGFVDYTGKEIIPLKYDYAEEFKNGYVTRVGIGKGNNLKVGLIDTAGDEIISPQYELIEDFHGKNSLAKFQINKKYGMINQKGVVIIPPLYSGLGYFNDEGYAIASFDKKRGIIDIKNQIVIPFEYDDIKNISEGFVGVFLRDEEDIIKHSPPNTIKPHYSGVAKISRKWGFIEMLNKPVIPLIYNDIHSFKNGIAMVKVKGESVAVDTTGTILTHDQASKYRGEYVFTDLPDKWGFINKEGKFVIPPKYVRVESARIGLCRVDVNDNSEVSSEPGGEGYINSSAKEIIPTGKYDYVGYFSADDSLVVVAAKNRYGYVDNKGKEVIKLQFDYAESFTRGLAIVGKVDATGKQKLGLINSKGKMITSFKFDNMGYFDESVTWFIINNKVGLINTEGKEILSPKYTAWQGRESSMHPWRNGMLEVIYDNKLGAINQKGEEVIPANYIQYIFPCDDHIAIVKGLVEEKVEGKNVSVIKEGLYDTNKKTEVVPLKYDEIAPYFMDIQNHIFKVKINGKRGYIDERGVEYFEN